MNKENKESDSKKRVDEIFTALQNAKSGVEVFTALTCVPKNNLIDMLKMINHILLH